MKQRKKRRNRKERKNKEKRERGNRNDCSGKCIFGDVLYLEIAITIDFRTIALMTSPFAQYSNKRHG